MADESVANTNKQPSLDQYLVQKGTRGIFVPFGEVIIFISSSSLCSLDGKGSLSFSFDSGTLSGICICQGAKPRGQRARV